MISPPARLERARAAGPGSPYGRRCALRHRLLAGQTTQVPADALPRVCRRDTSPEHRRQYRLNRPNRAPVATGRIPCCPRSPISRRSRSAMSMIRNGLSFREILPFQGHG